MPEDVPQPQDESSLEKMRERLYAPKAPETFVPPQLSSAAPQSYQTVAPTPQVAWTPPPAPKPKLEVKKRFSWTVLFLGLAVLFFVIAGGVSAFFLLAGGRTVSNDNIIITIQAPDTIASGTVVPLVVTIQNKNPAAISGADIQLNFPDGTRSADDVTQPLVRYADTIGTIPAGGTITRTVQAVLFGSVNQSISIPVVFQYNTANSNALFVKQQSSTFTVTSSPLTITAQSVSTIAAGQPFTIALTVRSNATTPLDNIAVVPQYPFGFTAQNVQISPSSSQKTSTSKTTNAPANTSTIFVLGTLAPGEQRTINVTGTLSGSDNDQRAFQFTIGTQKTDGTLGLSVAYASESTNVTLSKPFLSTTLSLNHGDIDPTIVNSGDTISGLLTWVNSLATSISNAQITIKLSGAALDPSSVTTGDGFYNSSTNTIQFTQQTEPALQTLNAGDTGTGTFSLSTKTGNAMNALRNPTIQLQVSVSGQPTGGSSESITNTLTNTIKVATDLALTSQIVHSVGPFPNSGSWPPVPNKPTTYTVELAVANSVNSVGGATATMILPSYVTFTGKMTPTDGSLSYNDTNRTVTWNIGDVAAGTGSATKALAAAFQISYVPSVSQSGTSPILVGNQTLVGTDRFTSTQVGNTAPALTTETTGDPAYSPGFGSVGN